MHKNIVLCGEQKQQTQSSVFYAQMTHGEKEPAVLKVYKQNDFKSYNIEVEVFTELSKKIEDSDE